VRAVLRAVFFDVDGVLLDSLPGHLAFCARKAKDYGLALTVPSVLSMRQRIADGARVSPMLHFFLNVGFPPNLAEQATREYETEFARQYSPPPFPDIAELLARLTQARLILGLVTANVARNVEAGLKDLLSYFDPRCRFYLDRDVIPKTKREHLTEALALLELRADECVFVGDQPADARAAREASVRFLGVSYGWGLLDDTPHCEIVGSVLGIADALVGNTASPA
jgi:HAD superfamily hydrolase (TIGR01549 family)